MENGDGTMQNMQTTYSIEFNSTVDGETVDMEVETKPKVEKKPIPKKKKKIIGAESDSDEEDRNKLEDNPMQVNRISLYHE